MKRASPKTSRDEVKVSDLPAELTFPGRDKLRLDECAKAMLVTEQHLLNLVTRGAIKIPSLSAAAFAKLPPNQRMIPAQVWRDWLATRYSPGSAPQYGTRTKANK
jgi:hypothetical protein